MSLSVFNPSFPQSIGSAHSLSLRMNSSCRSPVGVSLKDGGGPLGTPALPPGVAPFSWCGGLPPVAVTGGFVAVLAPLGLLLNIAFIAALPPSATTASHRRPTHGFTAQAPAPTARERVYSCSHSLVCPKLYMYSCAKVGR